MEEQEIWHKATKKPVQIEWRDVRGEKEQMETREGKLYGYKGQDVIIKGIQGEIYPCKIDIFEKEYDFDARILQALKSGVPEEVG